MKNYTYVLRFLKIQKNDFLRFLSCCTRFLEHCLTHSSLCLGVNAADNRYHPFLLQHPPRPSHVNTGFRREQLLTCKQPIMQLKLLIYVTVITTFIHHKRLSLPRFAKITSVIKDSKYFKVKVEVFIKST